MKFETVVKREELLVILDKNRSAHRAEFEKAIGEYREACIMELERWLERAKKGVHFAAYTKLQLPQDHTKDYDRVIQMVQMHQEPTIRLDEQTFANYVRDEWSWKDQFYTAGASNKAYSAQLRNSSEE